MGKVDTSSESQVIEPMVDKVELNIHQPKHLIMDQTNTAQDDALKFLSVNNKAPPCISSAEDAKLVRKIDRHLIPIIFVIYFLELMDKQTLSFSSVFGLARDTDLVGDEYSLLGSIVCVAQLIMQPFSVYFLVKFRLSIYVPVIVTLWGLTLACMAAAKNFIGLLIARFFLGAFEASVQASFVLIIQIWYKRREQGFRMAIIYSNFGCVNIFGSLIMYGLGHVKSTIMHPYQLVFLLLGTITLLVGIVSFFVFPDNAVWSKFLSNDEKLLVIERLRGNQQGLETKDLKINQVKETLLDIKCWLWMLVTFLLAIPGSGITVFGPLIIRGFGFDKYNVMLLLIPFGTLQVIFIFTAFWFNRRYGLKSPVILFGLVLCIAASAILLCLGRSRYDQPWLLFAYYLLSTFQIMPATLMNWQSSNVAGHTKKTASTAFMLMGSYSGSIVGPLLFDPSDQPYYRKGLVAILICFSSSFVLVVLLLIYLRHQNLLNIRRRIRKGKDAILTDYSMLDAKHVEEKKSQDGNAQASSGSRAFDDLTDLENDEFIYLY